ncbi:MAG: ABC transporter substrate-binding protein [Clostridia bacterium]
MTRKSSMIRLASRLCKACLSLAVVLSLSSLLSCSPPPVCIAIMTKLEAGSLVGSSEVNAARLAVQDAGMGKQVEVLAYDDGWVPERTAEAWKELRAAGINLVVTSHVSTCAVVVAELTADDDVVVLVTGATTNALTGLDDQIIRTIGDVQAEQRAMADWVRSRNFSSILVIRDTDNWAYTQPAIEAFASAAGPAAIRVIDISVSEPDLAELGASMAEAPFDLLYLLIGGSQTIAGTFAQLGRSLQPDCAVLFTPWLKTPALVETAGPALEGAWIPAYYPARGSDATVDAYVDRYRSLYGYAPNFLSLNVYAAVELLLQNIEAGRRKPSDIRQALAGAQWSTSFGSLIFDQYGDVVRPLYMIDDIAGEF